MLNRLVQHIRSNAVAYVALFVALGGTSYAALKLPANSVGTQQIKNHSITPIKLDPSKTGAVVRFWAVVGASGSGEQVVASHPKARVTNWNAGLGAGTVSWQQPFSPQLLRASDCCIRVGQRASAAGAQGARISSVRARRLRPGNPQPELVYIAVECPSS